MMSLRNTVHELSDQFLPLGAWLGSRFNRRVGILMMHGVHGADMVERTPAPSSSVSLEAFQAVIERISQVFDFIPLGDAVAMLEETKPFKRKSLVLTFDDSLKCLAERAAPWLSERGIPATFYLSTDVIQQQQTYWWLRLEYAWNARQNVKIRRDEIDLPTTLYDLSVSEATVSLPQLKSQLRAASVGETQRVLRRIEQMAGLEEGDCQRENPHAMVMDQGDVRTLVRHGHQVGCHTASHPNLVTIAGVALDKELAASRAFLEEITAQCCYDFCYPYGAYSSETIEAVRSAGFRSAVTTRSPGWNSIGVSSLLELNRFPLTGNVARTSYQLIRPRI